MVNDRQEGHTAILGVGSNPWEKAQPHLRETLDEYSYKNWFSQTVFDSFLDGVLTIRVPSEFFANWLEEHYQDAVSEAVQKVSTEFKAIKYLSFTDTGAATESEKAPMMQQLTQKRPMAKPRHSFNGFNPRYTFDRFVIGAGNRFAHAAARAVEQSPGRAYNPPLWRHRTW